MDKQPTTWETIRMMSTSEFGGHIDDVIDWLTSLRDSAVNQRGYLRAKIDIEEEWDNVEIVLRGERYLSEEEIAARKAVHARIEKAQLDRERAQYEMLKKKFEGQS